MSREIGQSRWYPWLINGALLVLALVSLAPLLWMLSVSFMPQGEATHFPPPLLPSSITTRNYHELFARTGMGGNFANSLLVSVGITLGSLLLNTMAGYAFAKLNFVGRERLFQVLMAALVIPAQVAMLPLNDFMWPLIVLTDQEHYTLPVALATLSREHIMDVEMMMAGAVVTVVPVLALFLVLQRYYIQGLLLGSVKG